MAGSSSKRRGDGSPVTGESEAATTGGGLEQFTGYLMKRAFNVVQADLARVLEPFGLRMLSFSTLLVVVDQPDITQTQLAQALSVERSNIVVLLDALEEAGLLTRNPVPNNRRAYALRATLAGRRLAERAREAVAAHEARLFAVLSEAEHAALRRALGKLMASRV
jgi:DNA-binding MarR family transcriptional regulator